MKFSILQQDLLPALQVVSRSVGIRSTLAVLDNILISTEEDKLKFVATNLEVGVIKYLTTEIQEAGETTVPAKTLVEIISGLGKEKIEIESNTTSLTIICGKFKATINGIPASEFPVIPLADTNDVIFSKDELMSVSQILFAAAVDEGRPTLTAVLIDINGNNLDFVATDGFRLAHKQVKLDNSTTNIKSLIPKKTFEEVIRIISEEKVEEISISNSKNQNQVIFKIGQTILSSRLVEGNFPNWEKIIPQQVKTRVSLDKEDIVKAVKLAAVFTKNEGFIVLNTNKQNLSLESSAKELGNQTNEIEAQIEGEQLKIAFNSKFLIDALINIPTSQIMIELSGDLSAALIKPIGLEGLQYVVMPIKLN